jgi:hypothetical protein
VILSFAGDRGVGNQVVHGGCGVSAEGFCGLVGLVVEQRLSRSTAADATRCSEPAVPSAGSGWECLESAKGPRRAEAGTDLECDPWFWLKEQVLHFCALAE